MVAVYVRENLPEPIIKIKSDKLELISFKVSQNIHAKSLHIVCWYRPPTAGVDEFAFDNLREIVKGLDREEKETILIGDTKCDLKCSQNANAKQLKSIYSEYQLVQLIKSNMRVAVTTTESGEQRKSYALIDQFSSSHSKYITEVGAIKTGMVDHYLVHGLRKIIAWRSFKSRKQKVIESRNMRRYNKPHFRNDIQQVKWETFLSPYYDNTTDMATIFQEIFESILDIDAILKRKRVRSDFAPWLTPSLKRSILERDTLKVRAENSPEI